MLALLAACFPGVPMASTAAQTLLGEAGGPADFAEAGWAMAFGRSATAGGPLLCVGAPFADVAGQSSGWVGFYAFGSALIMDAVGGPFDLFGYSISTSGDLDGDGWPDIVIGAPGSAATGDYVEVRRGSDLTEYPWSPIHAPIDGVLFGWSVAIVGDYDGDGLDDIAVGAPGDNTQGTDAGAVLIFRGVDGTGWTGGGPVVPQAKEYAGWALARVADIDGDGKDDVAIGCPGYDSGGAVDVGRVTFRGTDQFVSGPVTAELVGTQAGENYGDALAGGGDVNKDGVPDLVIGAPGWDGPGGVDHGRVEVRTGGAIQAPPPLWFSHEGTVASGTLGLSVAFAGDADHDGYDDVVAGAPNADGGDGRALVWSGRTSQVIYDRRGEDGERLGGAVAGGEDVDSDVYEDWAAGRPYADFPVAFGTGKDAGGFSVFCGKNHWCVPGPSGFGHSVAVAGDTDGDAFEDFLVGTYGGDPPNQRWTLISGFDSQTLHEEVSTGVSCEGYAVAGAGDVDGDGLADFLVGNPCGPVDTVVLRSGAGFGPIHVYQSPDLIGVRFGHAVAGIGDVDGDGTPDVLVGDPEHGSAAAFQAGAAWVMSGAPPYGLLADHHGKAGDHLGHSVAAAGDVDLDGIPDYALGLPYKDELFSEEGGAQVRSLAKGLLYAVGNTTTGTSHAGWSVAGIGDANGDGFADVAVGEPDWQGVSPGKLGRVRVYAGPAGAVHLTLDGPFANSRFGWAVAPAGDVDADTRDDFAVGIPGETATGGRVQILSGADGSLLHHSSAPFAGSNYGFSVGGSVERGVDQRFETIAGSPAGDVVTDGYVKVIISPFYVLAPIGVTCTDDAGSSYGMDMSPPLMGEACDLVVTDPPELVNAVAIGSPVATPFLLGSCAVYVNPFAPYVLIPVIAPATFALELLIPDDPGLAGLKLATQAFSVKATIEATHAIQFTLGY
jgi:hypothetical protein